MKHLLVVTALIESGAGVALLGLPSTMMGVLLGPSLEASLPTAVPRILGGALLALGIACWFASRDSQKPFARSMVVVMTAYNPGAVVLLLAIGLRAAPAGVLLWPAVALHAAMAAWCVACLMKKP